MVEEKEEEEEEEEAAAGVSVQNAFWHRGGVVNQFAEQFARSIVGPSPTAINHESITQ